jgi:hypothetical protein
VPTSSNPGGGVAELLGLEVGQLVGVGFSKSLLFKSFFFFFGSDLFFINKKKHRRFL